MPQSSLRHHDLKNLVGMAAEIVLTVEQTFQCSYSLSSLFLDMVIAPSSSRRRVRS